MLPTKYHKELLWDCSWEAGINLCLSSRASGEPGSSQARQTTWVSSTAFQLPTMAFETQRWGLDLFVLMGFDLFCYLLAWEEHRSSHHTFFRHSTGTHSRDQYQWGEKFNKLFLKAFLVFFSSGLSSLLQSQTLKETGGEVGVIKLSKISNGRGKRRDWSLGDKETW